MAVVIRKYYDLSFLNSNETAAQSLVRTREWELDASVQTVNRQADKVVDALKIIGKDHDALVRSANDLSGATLKAILDVLLYCYSAARAEKDKAIDTTKFEKFEAALRELAAGLTKKGWTKIPEKFFERIGRAKGRYPRAAQPHHPSVLNDRLLTRGIVE